MYKIFVFRKGRVKANYDNVRICVAIASQAGDWRQKRRIKINLWLKSESEKKLTCYLRCNEAKELVLQLLTMQ